MDHRSVGLGLGFSPDFNPKFDPKPYTLAGRFGYLGLGWVGWQSSQPGRRAGVLSLPTVAWSVVSKPKIGFHSGPRFFLRSFYVTPYCRDYLQLDLRGFIKVRPPAAQLWVKFSTGIKGLGIRV